MRISFLYKIIAIFSMAIIATFILINEKNKTPLVAKKHTESCLECHKGYGSLSSSHPEEIFGCVSCHDGNPGSYDEDESHKGMIINPSYLHHAQIKCVRCHTQTIKQVSASVMQTQKGIVDVMHEQWVEKSTSNLSKEKLTQITNSHIDKGCASCHTNQDESVFYDKNMTKGGGCANCHRVQKDGKTHPKFSTKIPSTTCLKCHNRSNRIGLGYFGKFESEWYGTPFKDGNLSNRIDTGRFYYELPPDIHHEKLGLDCIDCHTSAGVMGDGHYHGHMEEAVDIRCIDCHDPKFKKSNELATKLSNLNPDIPHSDEVAYTKRKNSPIYNLKKKNGKLKFYRKSDGKSYEFDKMSDNAYHTSQIHANLECSACHASWTPSCYGCHEVYFDKGKQFDWKQGKITSGEWQEFRSFLRFEEHSLGVGYNGKIMPFAPGCQVISTIFEDKELLKFHAMAMAGWEPHTTRQAKTCVECHFNPAVLGFGRGNLDYKNGKLQFQPYYDSSSNHLPFSYPIDAFVSPSGKQFQTTSREVARAFNKDEIYRVTEAYKCIMCHREWDDKIYNDFNASRVKFKRGETKCLE